MMPELTDDERKLLASYKDVFTGPSADVVLQDMMRHCSFMDETFDSDGLSMAFNEGRRSVILHILRRVNAPLDAAFSMASDVVASDMEKLK